jgi:hypothetical protein
MHLLGAEEIPAILQTSARVEFLRAENARLSAANAKLEARLARVRRSRMAGLRRALRPLFRPKSV